MGVFVSSLGHSTGPPNTKGRSRALKRIQEHILRDLRGSIGLSCASL